VLGLAKYPSVTSPLCAANAASTSFFLTHYWSIQRHGLRAVRQLDTALSPVVLDRQRRGWRRPVFQAAKDFLKASRPPAEQRSGINTRVLPKRALLPLRTRPGGAVTPCDLLSGLAFVSHGSRRGTLRAPTGQYHDRRLDATMAVQALWGRSCERTAPPWRLA
jgi:hypothetical protein